MIEYISSKHKKPIKLSDSNLLLLKLIGDLGFVNINQLDMLWSVINHYPTCFTRSILREWTSYNALLKKVDKPKASKPSVLSRTVYHLTNTAKRFLADRNIWPDNAVTAPNIRLNSHNEQAIEVMVQGIYAAAFKYQTLGTTNQFYQLNDKQSYIVTNPNFINEKIIVNESLKAPDGAGAQQVGDAKSKGRTVDGPQQQPNRWQNKAAVPQASRPMPTDLTKPATQQQLIKDRVIINNDVKSVLPTWLSHNLPTNESFIDTLPLLINQLSMLIVDGILVPDIVTSTIDTKSNHETSTTNASIAKCEQQSQAITKSTVDRLLMSSDSNKEDTIKSSIDTSITNAINANDSFEKNHARRADEVFLYEKDHRPYLKVRAIGKQSCNAITLSTANNAWLGDVLKSHLPFVSRTLTGMPVIIHPSTSTLNIPGSDGFNLDQGILNTGNEIKFWLSLNNDADTGDELNYLGDNRSLSSNNNPLGSKQSNVTSQAETTNDSQQAVQSFFKDARLEQEIDDHYQIYADRQWRNSYEPLDNDNTSDKDQQSSNLNDQGNFFANNEGVLTDLFDDTDRELASLTNDANDNIVTNTPLSHSGGLNDGQSVPGSESTRGQKNINNLIHPNYPKSTTHNTGESHTMSGYSPVKPPHSSQSSLLVDTNNHRSSPDITELGNDLTSGASVSPTQGVPRAQKTRFVGSSSSPLPGSPKSASAPVEALYQTSLPAVPSAYDRLLYSYPTPKYHLKVELRQALSESTSINNIETSHDNRSRYYLDSSKQLWLHHRIKWESLLWPQITITLQLAQFNLRQFSNQLKHLKFVDSVSNNNDIKPLRFHELADGKLMRELSLINNLSLNLNDYDFSPFNRQFGNTFAKKNDLPFVADMMVSFNRHHQRHELFVELDNRTETNDRQASKIFNYLQYAIKHPEKDIEVIFAVTDGSLSSNRVKSFSNVGRKLGNLANRIMQTYVKQNGHRVYLADLYQQASNLQVRLCGVSEAYVDVAEYLLGSNYFPAYVSSLNQLVHTMNQQTDWQATFIPNRMFKSLLKRPDLFIQVEGMNHAHYLNHKTKGLLRYLPTDQINRQNVWGKISFSYPKADITYQQPVVFGHEHELSTIMETYNLSYLAKKSNQYGYPIVLYPHRERKLTSVSLPLFKSQINWSEYYGFRQPLIVQPRFGKQSSWQLRHELRWLTLQYARVIYQFFLKDKDQVSLLQKQRYYQDRLFFPEIDELHPARSFDELHRLAQQLSQDDFINQLQLNELPHSLIDKLLARWPQGPYSLPIIRDLPYWNNQVEAHEHEVKVHYQFSDFLYNIDSVLPDSRTQPRL